MYKYFNLNPLGRHVNDCTVRAIGLAFGLTWDEAFVYLSEYARKYAIMPDEVQYIDNFLKAHFDKVCGCNLDGQRITVGEFVELNPVGTYLITMNGHITCCIDGCIYDTFNPSERIVWDVYKVE